MGLRIGLITLLLAALTGCGGGGSASVSVGTAPADTPFVIWFGNSSGDVVVDANNDAFAFFADNGCLYNFQTGLENPFFCLTSAGDTARYGGLRILVTNVRSVTGTCITALIDKASLHFIDIVPDTFGNEVVFVTDLHADFCLI